MNVPALNRIASHSPSAGQGTAVGLVSGPRKVTYYLIRSRERGQRLKAILFFLSYILAFAVTLIIGALANAIVG